MLICLVFLIMHPDLVLVISPSCLVRMFLLNSPVPSLLLMPVLLVECSMFSAMCWLGLLTICPMLCSSSTTLFHICLLLYAPGFLSMLLSIYANGSFDVLHCLYDWSFMYASAVTTVGFMCHLFHVMCLPFVVSWIVYDLLW